MELCFIPPLNVGQGTNAGKLDIQTYIANRSRRRKGDKKDKNSVEKLKDFQELLRVGLDSFRQCCDRGGFIVEHESGQNVLYKPFIHLVIGDTAGNNELSCHYNSSANRGIQCSNYSCMCNFEELTKVPARYVTLCVELHDAPNIITCLQLSCMFTSRCVPIANTDIERSMNDPDYAASISQHQVRSAFHGLPLSDNDLGLPGHMPRESLHVMLVGIYPMISQIIHDLIGKKGANGKDKDRVDQLHQRVAMELHRNSERDFPRFSIRFGWMDLTRLTGKEREGGLHIFFVLMHTIQGQAIMKPYLDKARIPMTKFVSTIGLLLAFNRWVLSMNIDRKLVVDAKAAVEDLANRILRYIPREMTHTAVNETSGGTGDGKRSNAPSSAGSNGWHTTKFHAIQTFLSSMQRFGSGSVFDGGHGEHNHIDKVKKTGHNTSKRSKHFAKEVAIRADENKIIRIAHDHVTSSGSTHGVKVAEGTQRDAILRGRYTMEILFNTDKRRTNYQSKVLWHDPAKRILKDEYKVDRLLVRTIAYYAHKDKFPGTTLVVRGYTELVIPTPSNKESSVVFRASPSYNGWPWYDWCIVRFPLDLAGGTAASENNLQHCFGRIRGFFQYCTPGYPTYHLTNVAKFSNDNIAAEKMCDNKTYAVIDCNKSMVDIRKLYRTMVTPFNIDVDVGKSLYILPVECIVAPLAVVTNWKSKDSTQFLAVLHTSCWKNVFEEHIREISADNSDHASDPPGVAFSQVSDKEMEVYRRQEAADGEGEEEEGEDHIDYFDFCEYYDED